MVTPIIGNKDADQILVKSGCLASLVRAACQLHWKLERHLVHRDGDARDEREGRRLCAEQSERQYAGRFA